MANHRTPDDVAPRYRALDSAERLTSVVPASPSVWTYGAAAPAPPAIPAPRTGTPPPFPRVADVPADHTVPTARTMPPAPCPTGPWPAGSGDAAHRSDPDEIASRATTTLIPSSPGARRSGSGPVFVDGSGRRARRVKAAAVTAAALAAGYVGVVVTGALAGSTGPAGVAAPVASGASLAPATPVLAPTPVLAQPSEVITSKPAPTTSPAKKRTTTRTTPKKVTPKAVAPVAPVVPVVPAPAAPVVPAPAAPAVPPAPAAPAAPATGNGTTTPGNGTAPGTGKNRGNKNQATTPAALTA